MLVERRAVGVQKGLGEQELHCRPGVSWAASRSRAVRADNKPYLFVSSPSHFLSIHINFGGSSLCLLSSWSLSFPLFVSLPSWGPPRRVAGGERGGVTIGHKEKIKLFDDYLEVV